MLDVDLLQPMKKKGRLSLKMHYFVHLLVLSIRECFFFFDLFICRHCEKVVTFIEDTGLKVQTSRGDKEYEFDQVRIHA